MSLPAIGVVIPCYKAEHTLRQTVESVLQGAPDNLQLVLVEDGSPDGTGALCDALAAQNPRVTALHQPNGGASAARNAGLDTLCRSGAEWVLFVDADDTLLPGLWQALPAAFDAQPGLILYGMVRASGPAPNPLAPGCYAGPAALGEAEFSVRRFHFSPFEMQEYCRFSMGTIAHFSASGLWRQAVPHPESEKSFQPGRRACAKGPARRSVPPSFQKDRHPEIPDAGPSAFQSAASGHFTSGMAHSLTPAKYGLCLRRRKSSASFWDQSYRPCPAACPVLPEARPSSTSCWSSRVPHRSG